MSTDTNVAVQSARSARSAAAPVVSVATDVQVAKRPAKQPAGRIPDDLLCNEELHGDIAASLPANYNFEILKTLARIRETGARRVALQMPEGLLMYACTVSDILHKYASGADTVVLGDVTYGACCVDDFSARSLGCDFLVHYAHSCLIPVQQCGGIPMLYVFIDISFDPEHLIGCLKEEFTAADQLALLGTIQFVGTLHSISDRLKQDFPRLSIPQQRPLSPGELLGCTAPQLPGRGETGDGHGQEGRQALVYVADGRFHLEAAMIANPSVPAFRYDPYSRQFTRERYDHERMRSCRREAIEAVDSSATRLGVVLGTLGRQGSLSILRRLVSAIEESGRSYVVVLLSEISPAKIGRLSELDVDAWVQVACPRLSIDWGSQFPKPLLTPYECFVALGRTPWREVYPMDYYAKKSGPWTNYHVEDVASRGPVPSW